MADDKMKKALEEIDKSNKAYFAGKQAEEASVSPSDKVWAEDIMKEYEEAKKFEDRGLETALTSAAGTASFSLTDRALIKLGIYTPKELSKLREANPGADIAGTLGGVALPALLTGGTSAAAQGAVKAGAAGAAKVGTGAIAKSAARQVAKGIAAPTTASIKMGQTVERAMAKALGEVPSKSLAKNIVKKSIARGTGSAVEGAAFGTGQLLREDALGDAQFNAENLMATAGTGALYGGLVGAALPAVGGAFSASKRAATKGKGVFGQFAKKAFDPVRDAEVLSNFSSSQVRKFNTYPEGKKFLQDLPDFWKNKIKIDYSDVSSAKRLDKVTSFVERKTAQLEDFINGLDDDLRTVSAPSANATKVYADAAQKVYDDFIAPFANKGPAFSPLTRQAKNIVESFKTMANKAQGRGRVTARELIELKRDFDKLNKSFYKSMEPAEAARAGFAAREYLNNVIADVAEDVGGPQMRATLKELNKDIHYGLNILKGLEKEVDPKFLLGFRDLVWGTIGWQVGNLPGLAVSAAGKLLDSDFKRIFTVLSSVEKANKAVTSKTAQSVKKFLSGTKLPASSILTGAIVKSKMSKDENGRSPKTRKEAFNNISKNIASLQGNPEEFIERVNRATYAVSGAAPMTAEALSATLINGVQFLSSKVPRGDIKGSIPGLQREYEPSDLEVAKFERYLQVVEHPLSVLEDLQAGTLTRDHVDALAEVYPDLYHRIRNQVIEQLDEKGMEIPYSRRIQLGILMDLDADPSMSGSSIASLQSKYNQPIQEQATAASTKSTKGIKPTMSGAREIKMDERLGSETYNITERSK